MKISMRFPIKKKGLPIGLILLFLLVGCSGKGVIPAVTPAPTTVETPSLTAEVLPTATSTYSLPPTAAPIVKTPTGEPSNQVETTCVQVSTNAPKGAVYPGTAVYYDPEEGTYELYDFGTGTKKVIPGKGNSDVSVSPDQKAFALHNREANKLMVFSSDGQLLHSIHWENGWGYVGDWFDHQRLLIELAKPDQSRPTYDEYPRTLLVLDLSTGETKELPPDFPDIDQGANIEWSGTGSTVYDPQLTRVIYPASVKNVGLSYILWDIAGNRKLMQSPVALGGRPRWFPDGTGFLFNGHDGEFYRVSRDGELSRITRLNQGTKETVYYSNYYSLSPNGRKVALWLESLEPKSTHLAVYDLEKDEMNDLCITAGYNAMQLFYTPIPVWSPDNQYLLVEARSQESGESEVLVVDVEARVAHKIERNRNPVGWLLTP